jgi:IS30 family transposase
VSVEWIYHYISTDKKAGGELYRHWRCQIKRRKRYGSVDKRGQIGDWEMDLLVGRIGGSVLMTAVERKARYTLIGFAPNKTAKTVEDCIINVMGP